ncbi:FAD-binding oxidoreductase [Falsochrobactrum sp. TDYN1]|uniref:FAD-binding oxidoreductase n=1 Tax=Falsochrobactrum tianjinense TaxID=2706015 RepID=A0A949PND9_9HYPH|nr:FAD-dependent oxidoreductase [Falsochrobactrum sp. TDYN1]MBV2143659.1 FAD-binding oxidoreductase [Falsochrobactrum sp. TDYN1]
MAQHDATKSGQAVCVIGGGLVGLFTALTLQGQGKQVILLEREEIGGRQGASFGNGCWINPGAIMPMSLPGLWRQVPGFLLSPNGPFTIRWRHLPALAEWLLRFLWAGRSWKQVEQQIVQRLPLLDDPVARYQACAKQAGVEHLILPTGTMYVYRDRKELDADGRSWELRKKHGIKVRCLEADELRKSEPELSSIYQYGMLIEEAATVADPSAFCRALGQLLIARGGEIVRAEANGFIFNGQKLTAIRSSKGEIRCTQAVISAGAWSKTLAGKLGDHVPLVSERGYHITIRDPGLRINRGMMHAEGKMAIVMTSTGLRFAGQVELASLDAPPRWERARILLQYAKRSFPHLQQKIDRAEHDLWMGHRPSTPDSLPVIGRSSASPDVVYAFGHGHTGVSMAPATARLVGQLLNQDPMGDELARAFSAKRF